MVVDLQAGHGIERGIRLLRRGEMLCLPVGEALTFRYALSENHSIYFCQAIVGNTVVFHKILEFDEASGIYVGDFIEVMEIIVYGKPDFEHTGILKQINYRLREADVVYAEQIADCPG